MKRDFSIHTFRYIIQWILSFAVSAVLMFLQMIVLTFIQKKFRFDEHVIKMTLSIFASICAFSCAFIFRKFSKIKGYICGLITSLAFCLVKFIMSLASGGVGKSNSMIYICLVCAALIGGIMSANKNKKVKWWLVKINKFNLFKNISLHFINWQHIDGRCWNLIYMLFFYLRF